MKYGTRLRELLESQGLKQADIADKINVSRSTVSFWINAEYPPLEGIEKICKALNIPVYRFFMTDENIQEITGVDPHWITLAKTIEHMPPDIQDKIMGQILVILNLVLETLDVYESKLEKNLDERRQRKSD